MIDPKLHKKLIAKWKKRGHGVYQTPKRIKERMSYFMRFIGMFEGRNVLELGCNAGLYGYEIAQVAKSYIGVDAGQYYIDQANYTKKFIRNPNVEFICATVRKYIDRRITVDNPDKIDALFCSYALYHFSNVEIDKLFYHVLPMCRVVLIQTRTQKRSMWKPYNKWKFWKPSRVVKWLCAADFECDVYRPRSKKFAEIVGKKEGADQNSI